MAMNPFTRMAVRIARHALFAALCPLCVHALGEEAAPKEARLRASLLDAVSEVNPTDPATGARRFISFAFITDFHKCRRVDGDDAAVNPVKTFWYGSAGVLTDAEPSIRLLGSVAEEAGLDAVIAGGDYSTAPIIGDGARYGLTEAEYTNEIWNVKAMFDKYLPVSVPLFALDGNHERDYTRNGADMRMSDEAWAFVQTNFNTAAAARARGVEVTYHRDLQNARLGEGKYGRFAGNSFHLDFPRLLASGGCNVRIACISPYDSASGGDPRLRVFDAAQFLDPVTGKPLHPRLTPEDTVIGMVSHEPLRGAAGTLQRGFMNGYSNPMSRTDPWNGGIRRGRGFFGLVCGHQHFANVKEIRDAFDMKANPGKAVFASMVQVPAAFTGNGCHFSIFVIDTDRNLLREIRVAESGVNCLSLDF